MSLTATKPKKKPVTGQIKTCKLRKPKQTGNPPPELTKAQLKGLAWEEKNRHRQILQQNLLQRRCDYNRVALPQLVTLDGSTPPSRVEGRALKILQTVLLHTVTFQVTKARIIEETGLKGKPLQDALSLLKTNGYMAPVCVRKDGRLHGWCYVVDLNGSVRTDGWVLHYSQAEDQDMRQVRVKRREMRMRKAGLPVQTRRRGRRTRAERAQIPFLAPVSQSHPQEVKTERDPLASPYNGEPLDNTEEYPLTPLAGGISLHASPEIPAYLIPDQDPLDDQTLDWFNHSELFQKDKIQEPLSRLSRGMSDEEIETWWSTCHLARMLDESLPPDQRFSVGQKRVHVRRMRRDPAYVHVIARHWLCTRQFFKRMPADVVTSNIQRRYSLEDTHENAVDHHTIENARRMINQRSEQDLGLLDAGMVRFAHEGPDLTGIPDVCADIVDTMETALDELHTFKLPRTNVGGYFKARLWCRAGDSGSYGVAMMNQMDSRGLNVPLQPQLRQFSVLYKHGRDLFQQAAYLLKDRADRDEILHYVFGHTWFGWYRELIRSCASLRLVSNARDNQVWKFKEIYDYTVR